MFTKKDLKNGDVVKKRNGRVEIVILDTDTLVISKTGCNLLSDINDDLTSRIGKDFDIVAVRRPTEPGDSRFDAFDNDHGEVVFER